MTGRDDQSRANLEGNITALLEMGDPTVPMPEPVRARIRARLAELETTDSAPADLPTTAPRRSRLGWLVAAAAVFVAALVGLWPGGPETGVSWAEVVQRLATVHSVTATTETVTLIGNQERATHQARIFFKDPGLSRTDLYPVYDAGDVGAPVPDTISIIHRQPQRAEQLELYPLQQRAQRIVHVFRGTASASRPILDLADEGWRRLVSIANGSARQIGEREIDGISCVGFEAPAVELFGELQPTIAGGTVRVWADPHTAEPLAVDVELHDRDGATFHTSLRDIRWDAPLADDLFDLSVPAGWPVHATRREILELEHAALADFVALRIGLDGGATLVSEQDVLTVRRGEQVDELDSGAPRTISLSLELTPEAGQRLAAEVAIHPEALLIADFNGETRTVLQLGAAEPAVLAIDLSRLSLSLAEIEERYLDIPQPTEEE